MMRQGLTCILHDWVMPISMPSAPDPETLVNYILETYPETDVVQAMNAWFFSLDPKKHWPNYATIVTTDEHDDASDLSRPGVFRLNLGVDKATFQRVAAADREPDYAAFDRLLPTPCTPSSSGSRSSTRATTRSARSSSRSWHLRTTDSRRSGAPRNRLGRQDIYLVWGERQITRHDDGREARGLRHEHPIERITMMQRQLRCPVGVSKGDRQTLKSGCLDGADQVLGELGACPAPA